MSTRSTSSSTCRIPAWRWRSATRQGEERRPAQFRRRSSDLTNTQCTPNTIHWTYDTYTLAHGTGTALTKTGGDSWFFVTADYAFGAALERDTTAAVQAAGGKVLGGVKAPLSTADFSSFLLQAQASKAKVIGLANAGADTTNSIKQAAEFGITAAARSSRHCFCSSPTSTRSASMPRKG